MEMKVFTRSSIIAFRQGKRIIVLTVLMFLSNQVYAQSHYSFSLNTGNNMTVLVASSISPTIQGQPLETGDEIGVFNRTGHCAGEIIWNNQNAAITVWGDNDQTPAVDGMEANDTLRFHIWDASKSKDFIAIAVFENDSQCIYGANKITKLQSLTVHSTIIRSGKFRIAGKNEHPLGMVLVFDLTGKIVARFEGIVSQEGLLEKIRPIRLPHGRYLATIQAQGAKDSKSISLIQ
jgi:hypothetical protein